MNKHTLSVLGALLLVHCTLTAQNLPAQDFLRACDSIKSYISPQATVGGRISVDKAKVSKSGTLEISFKGALAEYPLRDGSVNDIYSIVRELMPPQYAQYRNKFTLSCGGIPIERLKSQSLSADPYRRFINEHAKYVGKHHEKMTAPLVKPISNQYDVTKGLEGRHIAIWQSHGWYYESSLKRWEWQRARILETVEDLYTQSYVLPFLVPMLENAGANVLLPRERDWNTVEIIVDNDSPESGYSETGIWSTTQQPGFADAMTYYTDGENPFTMGSARQSEVKSKNGGYAKWSPFFLEGGEYAVYVSYQTLKKSTDAAIYEVHHKGGVTRFSVNQKMGGGTWIYLGRFAFDRGSNDQGVVLMNQGKKGSVISADAVKFGGGMGNIARKPALVDDKGNKRDIDFDVEPEISRYPRFTEGARYFLQWAGFNDTIYSPSRFVNDYNDDYMCRGRWVNTLSDGSYLKPDKKGYNIPLDLSFAFHTDAGTVLDDGIIGSLAIYTRLSNGEEKYPHKEDRLVAREYTDLVQSQIVSDVRALYEPSWSRRGLWDRSYAESRSPEVPGMLLELLSHQNLADMRYGLDPTFRFTVSRAIYKGMLRFLSYINGFEYVVQPLPVHGFAAAIEEKGDKYFASLSWEPTSDPLESTAEAKSYIVYTREGDGGFDNGLAVSGNSAFIEIEPGTIYSFKVSAVNEGGISFPSEILAIGTPVAKDATKVLVVNNFTRVSAPSNFASKDSTYAGFQDFIDGGIAWGTDISYIGSMHEYRRDIPWMDDDAPGFGASFANYETKSIAGNTFDYPYIHGKALLKAGYAFCSASSEAVMTGKVKMDSYPAVDLICGKQVTTMVGRQGAAPLKYRVFPAGLQKAIRQYTSNGGNILVSGADIATDIWDRIYPYQIDSTMKADIIEPSKTFAKEVLKYRWMTNYASKTGKVKSEQNPLGFKTNENYSFFNEPNSVRYCVESPDALNPVGKDAYTIFRYADNDISAGVAYKGSDYRSVSLGFPIETLDTQAQIDKLINDMMTFLLNK